jgi:hypothetical protein
MRFIHLIGFMFLFKGAFCQYTFMEEFSEDGKDIKQLPTGEFILCGVTSSSNIFVMKLNQEGDTIWKRTYNTINFPAASSIQPASGGNFMLSGSVYDMITGEFDALSMKIDSTGNVIWSRVFGGTSNEEFIDIKATSDGGFVFCGSTQSYGPTVSYDIYLVKLDSTGNLLWTKTIGGPGDETPKNVELTSDNGFIISVTTDSSGSGLSDVLIVKTDSLGNILWSKYYGTDQTDVCGAVKQTSDGGYILTGWTISDTTDNAFLIKTDALGDTSWTRCYLGGLSARAFDVEQNTDDGYIVGGETYVLGEGLIQTNLIRTDPAGNILWSKYFTPSTAIDHYCMATHVHQTQDNGFITLAVSGYEMTPPFLYLIKTDSSGMTGCLNNDLPMTVAPFSCQVLVPALFNTTGDTMYTTPVSQIPYTINLISQCEGTLEAIEISDNETFNLFPNPATNSLTIVYDKTFLNDRFFLVYDCTGNLVLTQNLSKSQTSVDLNAFEKGLYFIKINGTNSIQKFIKE